MWGLWGERGMGVDDLLVVLGGWEGCLKGRRYRGGVWYEDELIRLEFMWRWDMGYEEMHGIVAITSRYQ